MNPGNGTGRSGQNPGPKRFYREVSVLSLDHGFGIGLDRNELKTPARAPFSLPVRELADAVAAEWRGQGARVDPATMPLTALANTAIDTVSGAQGAVRRDIRSFAASDLVCYRTHSPGGLADRQKTHWDPVLAWAYADLEARFISADGIMPVAQPAASLERVMDALAPLPPLALAATHMVTSLTGSALLALRLSAGAMTADEVWRAAHVDEDWQIENWGADTEAQARQAARRLVFDAAAEVLHHSG